MHWLDIVQREQGLQFSPSRRCCKIPTFFPSESMYLFKKINVFCFEIYSFITVIFILFVINLFLYLSIKSSTYLYNHNFLYVFFHKIYIKLQFYFLLWLMFKYFAIHIFFTPAWDFTAVFLPGVKSDLREISLRLERVNNIRSLYGDQSEFTSLHCRLPKWNHTW